MTNDLLAEVSFVSVDLIKKEATYLVNGEKVTRGIVETITPEELNDHLILLGQGLKTEFAKTPSLVDAPITIPSGFVI